MGQLTAWMELACGILDAIATHSVRWKEAEYEEFRTALAAALDDLRSQPSISSVLISAGTLSQRIEHYQRNTQQLIDGSVSELRDLVRILMSSAGKARADCEGAAGELHQIEEIIRSARTAEELQVTKAHLIHALGRLREQTQEQEQAASQLLTGLQERVLLLEQSSGPGAQPLRSAAINSSASPPVPSRERVEIAGRVETTAGSPAWDVASAAPRLDAATGLPGQEAAEAAIKALKPADRPNVYVAAFHVKRMTAVMSRFGEKCGNEVLLYCAQQISRLAGQSEDNLFRWRGSGAFVALLNREGFLVDVRQEIGRAFGSKTMFESGNGSVLLPISVATNVMHAGAHNGTELIEGLEKFFSLAATQG